MKRPSTQAHATWARGCFSFANELKQPSQYFNYMKLKARNFTIFSIKFVPRCSLSLYVYMYMYIYVSASRPSSKKINPLNIVKPAVLYCSHKHKLTSSLWCRTVLCQTLAFLCRTRNGIIFRVTGHLRGEFTDPRWIPCTKASDAELWCFPRSASE